MTHQPFPESDIYSQINNQRLNNWSVRTTTVSSFLLLQKHKAHEQLGASNGLSDEHFSKRTHISQTHQVSGSVTATYNVLHLITCV